ncbi:MAG: hypothetical protein IT454_09380 [Planctomycetes bacterium]|nr:hypothetical protein [Planctomycetota bacterium]
MSTSTNHGAGESGAHDAKQRGKPERAPATPPESQAQQPLEDLTGNEPQRTRTFEFRALRQELDESGGH